MSLPTFGCPRRRARGLLAPMPPAVPSAAPDDPVSMPPIIPGGVEGCNALNALTAAHKLLCSLANPAIAPQGPSPPPLPDQPALPPRMPFGLIINQHLANGRLSVTLPGNTPPTHNLAYFVQEGFTQLLVFLVMVFVLGGIIIALSLRSKRENQFAFLLDFDKRIELPSFQKFKDTIVRDRMRKTMQQVIDASLREIERLSFSQPADGDATPVVLPEDRITGAAPVIEEGKEEDPARRRGERPEEEDLDEEADSHSTAEGSESTKDAPRKVVSRVMSMLRRFSKTVEEKHAERKARKAERMTKIQELQDKTNSIIEMSATGGLDIETSAVADFVMDSYDLRAARFLERERYAQADSELAAHRMAAAKAAFGNESQSPLEHHFGFGEAAKLDKIAQQLSLPSYGSGTKTFAKRTKPQVLKALSSKAMLLGEESGGSK